jgi:hypothetical protein
MTITSGLHITLSSTKVYEGDGVKVGAGVGRWVVGAEVGNRVPVKYVYMNDWM